jgi:hypothetical protein
MVDRTHPVLVTAALQKKRILHTSSATIFSAMQKSKITIVKVMSKQLST